MQLTDGGARYIHYTVFVSQGYDTDGLSSHMTSHQSHDTYCPLNSNPTIKTSFGRMKTTMSTEFSYRGADTNYMCERAAVDTSNMEIHIPLKLQWFLK